MDLMNHHSFYGQSGAAMVVVMVFLFSRLKSMRGEVEPIVYGPRVIADEHRKKTL
jgi:hypothetical protein